MCFVKPGLKKIEMAMTALLIVYKNISLYLVMTDLKMTMTGRLIVNVLCQARLKWQ